MHQFEIFPWNHNFDTGIEVIDTQHKELVRLLNSLVSHIAIGAEPPVLEEVITELNNYVLYHFSTEEQIWASHFEGDAWYKWHHQSHDDFIQEIEKIRKQESSRAFDETLLDIVKFLTHWLARHILDSDRRMAKVVQALPTGISLAMAKEAADAEMSGAAKVLVDTLMNMYDRLADSTVEMSKEIQRRQRAELELLRAKTQLEIGSQAKSVYLANLSHELRTPLNTILGYVELLRRNSSVLDLARSELDVIHSSGDHLLTVINEVLEIAKIEAGHAQVESEAVDLERIAQETVEMFQLRARDKGLTLRVERSSSGAECILSDEPKVRQIVINLVSNAINATRHGNVTVRLAMGDASAAWAVVEVEDTGVGIAEADLVRVFAPFERLAHTDAVAGTGLGLAISKEFAHVLGGSIEVRSQPGEGSVFRLSLPNKQVARGSSPPVTKVERDIRALAPGQAPFRVLVVDDESTHRDLLTRLLAGVGFEVCEACDGEHAVVLFQQWRPHFIWMDSHMPKLSGPDATRIIRGLEGGLVVRIAALTASIFSNDDIRSAGMDAVVHKPFTSHQIFDCMQVLLGVEYLYQLAPSVVSQSTLDLHQRLVLQPQGRRDALANAVGTLSQDAVLSAIADIAQDDPALAFALEQMARKYHYAALQQLLTNGSGASLPRSGSSSFG